MTPKAKLKQLARVYRWRWYRESFVHAFGLGILAFVIANRFDYFDYARSGILALIFATISFAVLYFRGRTRKVTALKWAHYLDGCFPVLEDSTELLLQKPRQLNPIQKLQKEHVTDVFEILLQRGAIDQTQPAEGFGRILVSLFTVAILGNGIWLVRGLDINVASNIDDSRLSPSTAQQISVRITPPNYTGLGRRELKQGSFDTVEGTRAVWAIKLRGDAKSVELRMHDQQALVLRRDRDGTWLSRPWTVRSSVYQIIVDDTVLEDNIYQISVKKDRTPTINVEQPNNAVTSINSKTEKKMGISAMITDDFGIVQSRLRLTLAHGSGEQVQFREVQHPLQTREVDRTRNIVTATLNLTELGMEPGAELYFFVEAQDNRVGEANVGSSGTFIVKWPSEEEIDVLPVDTLTMEILPEYFRSQRQIIIDTRRLLGEKATLSEDKFNQRSQDIAFDQKLLRLRYGQFLGEEFESNIGPTNEGMESEDDEHEDHNPQASILDGFQDAIADVAHLHDQEEQATLFDPETRDLLKRALAEMWDAELNLRLMTPRGALPFEIKALDHIKQVQQRSRIYLARVGFNPTPIDPDRRLSAQLSEIRDQDFDRLNEKDHMRRDLGRFVAALTQNDLTLAESIVSLNDLENFIDPQIELDANWLGTMAALKRLQANPNCQDCMHDLSAALWQRLDDPLPVPHYPNTPSKMARDFYDALAEQGEP